LLNVFLYKYIAGDLPICTTAVKTHFSNTPWQ